jgi:hypothetical protein
MHILNHDSETLLEGVTWRQIPPYQEALIASEDLRPYEDVERGRTVLERSLRGGKEVESV